MYETTDCLNEDQILKINRPILTVCQKKGNQYSTENCAVNEIRLLVLSWFE